MTVILAIGAQSAPSGAPAPGAVVELAGVARHADGPDEVAVRDGAAQPHQRNVVLKVLVVVVGVNDDSGQRSADLIRTRGTLILFSKEQAPKSKVGTTFEKGGGGGGKRVNLSFIAPWNTFGRFRRRVGFF